MALGDSYASVPQLELRLGKTDDGSFTDKLATASRHVERFCARQFNNTTTATARLYRPVDVELVVVDDLHTITDLEIAVDHDDDGTFETIWSASDYQLEPPGGVVDGEPGWPYWVLRAIGDRRWPCMRRVPVRVTAQWGWAAVPPAVVETTLAVAEASVSTDSAGAGSVSIGRLSVTYDRDRGRHSDPLLASAAPYRRLKGFA